MTMTEKLDILMSERGINKSQLSRLSGIPYMTIVNFYEKGTENIKRSTLIKLSRYFDVTVDYLIIDEETRRAYPSGSPKSGTITALPTSVVKPRIYRSVKGFPLLDEQNVACYDEVPQNIRCDFTMRVTGDSMKKLNINDGDIVYAVLADDVRSHEVAVVVLDGALTLRRVYKNENQIVLMAENPAFAPVVMRAGSNVRILGKAVAFLNPNAMESPF
jgi:repressor LexA